jgi:phage shock protein PspC (stress-responsive transcriptional regulator)
LIAGVCAGVARHLDIDVTLVRIVWVLLTIFPPVPGIILYIIFWIVMPWDRPREEDAAGPGETQQARVSG